ncbi:DNA repair RAD52-like protein 1, mitochondrial [Silene latifolia]|uniref:DNA repair RAD52-like protein 1, mitochondrial n=1 Tax=Silene latifolia TaxID=37657 RepID=UPI003D78307E
MASIIFRTSSLRRLSAAITSSPSITKTSLVKSPFNPCPISPGQKRWSAYNSTSSTAHKEEKEHRRAKPEEKEEDDNYEIPTEGISRPLSVILKQLNKKVPKSLISVRFEDDFSINYIPWHIVNRIMNLHAPEWPGEVRNITYSPDDKFVSVVYHVTLPGTDAEISRESTGTVPVDDKGYGDPVQKAEAMAFRRACARLGLGLHLYYEDLL